MYSSIRVYGPGMASECFTKGVAIELQGKELSLYPVNVTTEEFNSIIESLKQVKA